MTANMIRAYQMTRPRTQGSFPPAGQAPCLEVELAHEVLPWLLTTRAGLEEIDRSLRTVRVQGRS